MKKIRSRINKIAKMSLAFLMACSVLQMMNQSKEVHATTTNDSMMLWNDETKEYLNPPAYEKSQAWQGSKLYWGNNGGTPLLWRVLSTDDSTYATNSVLIQGEDSLGYTKFHDGSNAYMGSTLATFIDTKFGDSLTEQEGKVTLDSAKEEEEYIVDRIDYKDAFDGKKWFAPTAKMMSTPTYGYPNNRDADATRSFPGDYLDAYWLASAYVYNRTASNVSSRGDSDFSYAVDFTLQARAASSLNPDSILLVSNAEGGKPRGSGQNALTPVSGSASGTYKLTVKDENQSVTDAKIIAIDASNVATIQYSKKGGGTSLSAIVLDSAGKDIISYGRIASDIGGDKENQTATITLPSNFFTNGYKLKVFTENVNGDKQTDYASAFYDVTVPTTPITKIEIASKDAILSVAQGKSLQMSATIAPTNATYKEVTWSIANKARTTSAAAISSTGLLTGNLVGTVTVVATAKDGSGIAATMMVNVIERGSIVLPGNIVIKPSIDGTPPVENSDGTITVPNGGKVEYPNGNVVTTPNGGVVKPDGDLTLPNGSIVKPNGSVVLPLPEGDIVIEPSPDGKFPIINGDGTITVPEGGKVEYPSGNGVTTPNGGVVKPEGTLTLPDGTTHDKQGNMVEKPTIEEDTSDTVDPDGNKSETVDMSGDKVNTGDSSNVIMYVLGTMISLTAIVFGYKKRKIGK